MKITLFFSFCNWNSIQWQIFHARLQDGLAFSFRTCHNFRPNCNKSRVQRRRAAAAADWIHRPVGQLVMNRDKDGWTKFPTNLRVSPSFYFEIRIRRATSRVLRTEDWTSRATRWALIPNERFARNKICFPPMAFVALLISFYGDIFT